MSRSDPGRLLRASTVRVRAEDNQARKSGTGVFVSPSHVITCRHVLEAKSDLLTSGELDCFHGTLDTVSFKLVSALPDIDLALLEVAGPPPSHSWVRLASDDSLDLDVEFLSVGFPGGNAEAEQTRFHIEGTREMGDKLIWKLRQGRAVEGMSGSGLLHPRTCTVCAFLSEKGGDEPDAGAYAVQAAYSAAFSKWLGKVDASPEWDEVLPEALLAHQAQLSTKAVFDRSPSGLSEPCDVALPSPILPLWDDFLANQTWRKRVETLYQRIARQGSKFDQLKTSVESLRRLDHVETYDEIVSGIRRLYPALPDLVSQLRSFYRKTDEVEPVELRDMPWLISALKNEVDSPSFQRCFFALGAVGSGKSTLLAQLMHRSQAREGPLVIAFSPLANEPIRDAVQKQFLHAIDGSIESFGDYELFLRNCSRPVVLAIDDAHLWIRKESGRLAELQNLIREGTRHENLYWLILADVTGYDVLLTPGYEGGSFWREYGFSHVRPEPGEKRDEHGMVMLDEENRKARLGVQLLRRLADREPGFTLVDGLDLTDYGHLMNPWLARLFWSLRASLQAHGVVNLQYVQLLNAFWELRRGKVLCGLTHSIVARAIGTLCSVLMKSAGDARPDEFETALAGSLEPVDRRRLLRECLADAGLLRISAWEDPDALDALDRHRERVELLLPLFWEWRTGIEIAKAEGGIQESIALIRTHLLDSLSVAQFTLLTLDLSPPDSGAEPWLLFHGTPNLRAAAWFALPKAQVARQAGIWTALAAAPPVLRQEDRRDLFALLFMSTEVDAKAVSEPAERFRLVQAFYTFIAQAGLSEYFAYAGRRAIDAIEDVDQWKRLMLSLEGCHAMSGAAVRLASHAARKLEEFGLDLEQRIRALLDYAQKLSRQLQNAPRVPSSDTPYFKLVLGSAVSNITERRGLNVFDTCYQMDWYDRRALKISGSVSIGLKQALNCALGDWYRHRRRDETLETAYVDLVNCLAGSDDSKDREIAFYLIKHSEVTDKRQDVKVGVEFRPALKILSRDRALTSSHKRMFEANLSGDTRESRMTT